MPCILIGLSQAPQVSFSSGIGIENLDYVILPYNALGGIPAIEANKRNIQIYAIKENNTILDVCSKNFLIKCDIINTYEELLELI